MYFQGRTGLKNPQYYETHNPAASLQFQYILGFIMALVAAFLYLIVTPLQAPFFIQEYVKLQRNLASDMGLIYYWIL